MPNQGHTEFLLLAQNMITTQLALKQCKPCDFGAGSVSKLGENKLNI